MNTKNEIKPAAPAEALDSGRCAVDALLGLRWAVYSCGWKIEVGDATRETETPTAIFRYSEHAEKFCKSHWPGLGEVRPWPNTAGQTRPAEPL